MRTISQLEQLVKANRISERDAIDYVIEYYGDENHNLDKFEVYEDYCAVDSSGRSQNVNWGDYVCSGEIIDWIWWHHNFYKNATLNQEGELEIKIYHSIFYSFINGELKIIKLYDILKETDIYK